MIFLSPQLLAGSLLLLSLIPNSAWRVSAFAPISQSRFLFPVAKNSIVEYSVALSMANQDTPTEKKAKAYAPPQVSLDPKDGSKWRVAVACAVFNSHHELLVGERIHIDDAWQAPQGGVDGAWAENNFQEENILQAATRELYEEMGLELKKDVILVDQTVVPPIRYDTSKSDNWLTKSGFQGQELHWCVFRCSNGRGDVAPLCMSDLAGKNGEAAEFSQVAWKPLNWVVENMWPAKRAPYESLQNELSYIKGEWEERCNQLNFEGVWSRDPSLNENVVEGFEKRGLPSDRALKEAMDPYIQNWIRKEKRGSHTVWTVETYDKGDTSTIRRTLDYPIAAWKELFLGKSVLFNQESGDYLDRQTMYVAEPEAEGQVAHVTITHTPQKGVEESRRYVKDGKMILRRTFWPREDTPIAEGVVSTEIFFREANTCSR